MSRFSPADEAQLLLTAVQLLTRAPTPGWVGHGPELMDRATRYFPLVGIGVALLGTVVFGVANIGLPPPVAALLSVAAMMLATGALHEDGLADTCDGLFGSADRDKALHIMRDSRLGAYGVAGLTLALGLRVAMLATLPAVGAALVAAHAGSRFMVVCVIAALPYARTDGKAAPVAGKAGMVELAVAGLCGVLSLMLLGERALPALAFAAGVAWLMARWFRARLGGYTGDGLGAVQQATELAILLAALWHAA